SYLVSNAIVLPFSGWVSGMIGRKRFYMLSVLLFTISSALCGLAPSLPALIFFRVLQGIGGGGLQPSEQAILVDTFPPAKRGMAMAVYGMAILVAPILGPTLGGFITDHYSWRWIFYINIPVGCLSLFLSNLVLEDPPYLEAQRAARRGKPIQVDYIGLGLLALGLGAFQIMLDKGQEEDWFGSHLIVTLAVVAGVTLIAAIFWELHHPHPMVNLRLLKDRNFAFCGIVIFSAFGVLYGSTVLLPTMMQTLMGYSATLAGLVMSPAGFFTMLEMPIIGILLSRGVDARWLIMTGLGIVAVAAWWMSTLSLEVTPYNILWPRIVQTLGAGLLWVPINTAAYLYVPRDQTSNASGLFNLIRNEGASIGVAMATTLLQRHSQMHQLRLSEHVTATSPAAGNMLSHLSAALGNGDPVQSVERAHRAVYGLVQQQALLLSYLDLFRIFALASLFVIPLVLLMRRAVPHKGAEMAVH
ncbi:MAG TPA: DHA2 family efflux MFS transporter permease subunit, partial [Gemmataceae bacterium]|nr:DHA2 family efflux MFS transporter permease subunit [Gemmataceae bacterium]